MDNVSTHTQLDEVVRANQYGVMVYTILMNGNDPGGVNRGVLVSLSEQTGGGFFTLNNRDDLPATFARVSEELRHQYVFGITVPADGQKHKFYVIAKREGSTTRAHRVYMTANPLSAAAKPATALGPAKPSAPIALPTVPVDVPSLVDVVPALDRFERGDWAVANAPPMTPEELEALLTALRAHAPEWIAAESPAGQRRRRLAVATFALDVLYVQTDPFLWLGGGHQDANFSVIREGTSARYRARLPAAELLAWAEDVLKPDPPLPAERWWHLAAIGLLERSKGVDALDQEIDRARSRFPTEERWALAHAVSAELETWPDARDDHPFNPTPQEALPIEDRYADALQRPSIKSEAQLRLGYFELRRGRVDAALKDFTAAGAPSEAALRYWLSLFEGQALEQKADRAGALEAYRKAFTAVPYALSASLALASALADARRGPESAALMMKTLSIDQAPVDPWALYTLPDMRFWDYATSNLRAAIARTQ
jgi:tetratricopeptide (TPR) repeat protein